MFTCVCSDTSGVALICVPCFQFYITNISEIVPEKESCLIPSTGDRSRSAIDASERQNAATPPNIKTHNQSSRL